MEPISVVTKQDDNPDKSIQWEPYKAAVSASPVKHSSKMLSTSDTLDKTVKIPYKIDPAAVVTEKKKARTVSQSSTSNSPAETAHGTIERHEPGDGKSDAKLRQEPTSYDTISDSGVNLMQDDKYKRLVYEFESIHVDRDSLMEQLQVQLKVNAELKQLLVATMGDDLQLKMECLTHDKARLAQDIVRYSHKLTNDQENLERMNIQCDVWRSKFLASSVMVDELVSWRFFLIRQFEESQRALKKLLEEHDDFRKHLFQSFLLLQETKEALDPLQHGKYRHLVQYHTIYDLLTTVHSLSDALHHRLLNNRRSPDFYGEKREPMIGLTEAEVFANKIVSMDAKKFYESSPCDEFQQLTDKQAKLMGYPTHCNFRNITVNCCRKCAGEIKLV